MEIRKLWIISLFLLSCPVSRVCSLTTATPIGNSLPGGHKQERDDLQLPATTPESGVRGDRSENLFGCEHLSVKGSHQTNRIREIRGKDYTFFVHPKEDFTRLTFRLLLQNVLDVTDVFDTQETVEVHKADLEELGQDWVKVHVQYYRYARTGPNYQALRVTVGANTLEVSTKYWWLTHTYEGFLLSAEGGLDMIFNCSPEEYFLHSGSFPQASSPSSWVWFLAAGSVSLILLLFAVGCIAFRFRNNRQLRQDASTAPNSVVYEEFNEEILAKLQQKIEALREGRASKPNSNDCYVIEMASIKKKKRKSKDFPGTHEAGDRIRQENHYDVLNPSAKKKRRSKALSLQWNCTKDECPTEENYYETLYPLNHTIPLEHDGGGRTSHDREVRKSRGKSWQVVSSDDPIYENL
ncbi:uncharacterized protein [Palaemon carinicauda]|uniref:uncharacterized protein n=1 Tax=Palaemon carinicauda TaxID=392227 RepID=UPI0035B5E9AD